MNVNLQGISGITAWGRMSGSGLKSTQQKMERQQKCESQVAFLEKQKDNLKNMQCGSLEEIAHKLEMFHSYEDQIAAAKKEFNYSQMMHALDEARERGEKIAEAAEKTEPKTAEERRKDMQEEALGTEESKGMLTELMEEISENLEEVTEEAAEELLEESTEQDLQMQEELQSQEAAERPEDLQIQEDLQSQEAAERPEDLADMPKIVWEMQQYQHFDQSV